VLRLGQYLTFGLLRTGYRILVFSPASPSPIRKSGAITCGNIFWFECDCDKGHHSFQNSSSGLELVGRLGSRGPLFCGWIMVPLRLHPSILLRQAKQVFCVYFSYTRTEFCCIMLRCPFVGHDAFNCVHTSVWGPSTLCYVRFNCFISAMFFQIFISVKSLGRSTWGYLYQKPHSRTKFVANDLFHSYSAFNIFRDSFYTRVCRLFGVGDIIPNLRTYHMRLLFSTRYYVTYSRSGTLFKCVSYSINILLFVVHIVKYL
jgi:hypothetical protein